MEKLLTKTPVKSALLLRPAFQSFFCRKWQPLQPDSAPSVLFASISLRRASRTFSTGISPPS